MRRGEEKPHRVVYTGEDGADAALAVVDEVVTTDLRAVLQV